MQSVQHEPTLLLYCALKGGWIVWCMMLKIEHHAYCAALYGLSHSNGKCGLCATKHWKKQTNKKRNKMARGKICATQTPKPIWHISEALKPRSLTDRQGPYYSRQGWKTDTVSQSWWCTLQLLVVLHVTSGMLNLIVWCVPVVRRHYSRALANSSPGSDYKWAVCICMTPGIWTPLNQSHIGYSRCWLSALMLPFASLPPSLYYLSLCWFSLSCFLSPCAISVFLCSPSFFPLPITFFLLRISQHFSFQCISKDSGFSKTAKCFHIKGSFASHSWCGGEPACSHRRRGRDWCWRVPTVRLSSTLFPLGGTCIVGRNFMNNNLPLL